MYDETNDPSGILRKLQETAWVEHIKETSRLKEDRPKIWGDMELSSAIPKTNQTSPPH